MRGTHEEILEESGAFYGEIPPLPRLYTTRAALEVEGILGLRLEGPVAA